MHLGTKLATGALAGVLTLAMTGAAAFAAFQPAEPVVTGSVYASDTETTAAERGKNTGLIRALEAILGRLVANGTITEEQKAEVLEVVGPAAEREAGAGALKRIWGRFMELSVAYLELEKTEVGAALRAGTSLGDLADDTEDKSRADLILFLVVEAEALIDQAVADGRITEERADEAKARLTERVTAFVDHVYELPRGKELGKELRERAKERAKELKERFKELRQERKADRDEGSEDEDDQDEDSGDEDTGEDGDETEDD